MYYRISTWADVFLDLQVDTCRKMGTSERTSNMSYVVLITHAVLVLGKIQLSVVNEIFP